MKVVVTGGLGFIGSAVIRHLISETEHQVLNIDAVTYAATYGSLEAVADNERYRLVVGDIADPDLVGDAFSQFGPDALIHLAAESHVDRSIDDPGSFVHTNLTGTYVLLEAARRYVEEQAKFETFRFVHVSTDEVFGSLGPTDPAFDETTPYEPRSPYSASKAGSDHLVRAWFETYGLGTIITNCSNNYGPFQFPEKLIPLMIIKAMKGEALPVYGDGLSIRDWLFVDDHAEALVRVLEAGDAGETYAIGGRAERDALTVVNQVCDLVDNVAGTAGNQPRRDLIGFVADRPGHDRRYAVNPSKIVRELGWEPSHSFEQGLEETVRWYLANDSWWAPLAERYQGQRLGQHSQRPDQHSS